jgi:peptide/nickel transport system substrate-binding protein
MKSKTWFALIAVILFISLLSGACTPLQATENPATEPPASASPAESGATITIGTIDKFASFDPADATAEPDLENILNINEGLLRHKPGTTDLEPALATGMPEVSPDGLTYTFTLRDGIKFGDGTPLTAKTYVAQLTRLMHSLTNCPNNSSYYAMNSLVQPYVQTITAPDEKTLVFKLNTYAAFFPQILATAYYVPTNPATFPLYTCVPLPPAPIYGVGPWYVSQYNVGDQVVFEPNPFYNGDLKPQVGKIILKQFADEQALSKAIQGGQVDIAWANTDNSFDAVFLDPLKKVSGLHIGTVNGGDLVFMIINHSMAPMDDPNVVKAIASAVDRQALVEAIFNGWATPAYSPIPAGWFAMENTFDSMYGAPDLDKARQYLAASGYTAGNPLQLNLSYSAGGAHMPLIKKQLEATGAIQITLTAVDSDTFQTQLWAGKTYSAGVTSYFSDFADPAQPLAGFIYYNNGTNINALPPGALANKASQMSAMMNKTDDDRDPADRAALFKQIQEIYADLVVTLPLDLANEHVVFRDGIQGDAQYGSPEALNIGPMLEFYYSTLSLHPASAPAAPAALEMARIPPQANPRQRCWFSPIPLKPVAFSGRICCLYPKEILPWATGPATHLVSIGITVWYDVIRPSTVTLCMPLSSM